MRLCKRVPGAKIFILFSGPRMATKTVLALNCIAHILWTVRNSRFVVISPTVTAGDDSGCWTELCDTVIPKWIAGGFGMKWVTEPKQKGATKKMFFEVTNQFGGVSRCHLDSLPIEKDVEVRFKNKNYTGIYVSELSHYKSRKTFDIWRETLRGADRDEHEFVFIGDTNPAEEGKQSWIWKLWWEERLRETDDSRFKTWQNQLALMEFSVADNIFMSEDWHKQQAAKYLWSEDLLKRYYHGEWVMATSNSVFHDVFRPTAHIIGEPETPVNLDPEILMPAEDATEGITGWDLGVSNSAACILFKRWERRQSQITGQWRDVSIFDVIDEVVYLKSDADLDDFVNEFMDKIWFWEQELGREIRWRNWSDRSAFDMRAGLGNIYHHQLVSQVSKGRIILQAADRSPGSIRPRVDLMRKLFYEDRIFVCKSRCPFLIESLQGLPPGKAGAAINKESHYKHVFDALSYAIVSECVDEVFRHREGARTGRVNDETVSIDF
jgi:hypothetical protein